MTPEQKVAFINAQIAFFNARIAGMVAENMHQQACGTYMAYREGDFTAVELEFEPLIGHNAIIAYFKD